MNEPTLEELYQRLKQMREVEENRTKKVSIWSWSTEKQVGACCFDKVGVVVGAGNEWETREETSTIPVLRVDER